MLINFYICQRIEIMNKITIGDIVSTKIDHNNSIYLNNSMYGGLSPYAIASSAMSSKKENNISTEVYYIISKYLNDTQIRTYEEATNFITNLKLDMLNQIKKNFEEGNINKVAKYSNMYNEIEEKCTNDININLEQYKQINDDMYIIPCSYCATSFYVLMNKKEFANAKIRK